MRAISPGIPTWRACATAFMSSRMRRRRVRIIALSHRADRSRCTPLGTGGSEESPADATVGAGSVLTPPSHSRHLALDRRPAPLGSTREAKEKYWPRRLARQPRPESGYRAGAACAFCWRRQAQLFVADERCQDRNIFERNVYRLAQHRGYRLPATAIGDAGQSRSTAQHEQLAGQMRQTTWAGMGIVEFAWIGFAVFD
jgi:hypothetical protein